MPDVVGSLPSVVYVMWSTPDPLPSLAPSVTVTGELLFQPAPFGAGASWAVAVGAVVSTMIATLASEG